MPNATQVMALGVIALFVAVSVPMLIDATTGETQYRVELEENETATLTESLDITSERIRPPDPTNATITVSDTNTLEEKTKTIRENESKTYAFSGGNVTVKVSGVEDSDPERVTAYVTVPNQYGMSDGARTIANNLGLIVAAVGFIVLFFVAGSVIQ